LHLVPGIGPRRFRRLLERFGSPERILGASESDLLDVVGVTPQLAQSIRLTSNRKHQELLDRELHEIEEKGVRLYFWGDPDYPQSLAQISDPPCVLYVRGQILPRDEFSIAIVGSRRISNYGRTMSRTFASELARSGLTIISGFARGADSQAHWGALESGGRTIAVFGNGLNVCYPRENKELLERIVESGALVSELPMNTGPLRENFPLRNRLISALSLGTLVVEAPKKSGALITARYVAEHGKHLFALPGRVGESGSVGPHSLIREGAVLVQSPQDIMRELESLLNRMQEEKGEKTITPVPESVDRPVDAAIPSDLSESERRVLSCISDEAMPMDEVTRKAGISAHEAAGCLLALEMRGLVARLPGMRYILSRRC
ncbi:MAG TPA: DNA-processing protein DprA, partial [bacterium]|nr:DNA-processing protein DprA [bacterium]